MSADFELCVRHRSISKGLAIHRQFCKSDMSIESRQVRVRHALAWVDCKVVGNRSEQLRADGLALMLASNPHST